MPEKFIGFAIDQNYTCELEARTIVLACMMEDIKYRAVKNYKEIRNNEIPVGNVKFIQNVLGYIVKPNYYPEKLNKYLHRKIWCTTQWPLGQKVFVKPADEYKRFTGFVTNGGYKGKKRGPYVCSEVIRIIDEWRYYICNGEILYAAWYDGRNENKEPPELDINFDQNECSCVDIGMLENDQLVLVEWQHAFSCGWYGNASSDTCRLYAKWIAYGWNNIRDKEIL